MLVEKVINNNIVSAFDDTGKELVVMGRGLGFGARPGQPVDEKKIEKNIPDQEQGYRGPAQRTAG